MKTKLGWVLSILVSGFLLFSAFNKLTVGEEVLKGMEHLGVSPNVLTPLAIVEILAALLCLIPRTAFIGVILVTGWMGGAIFAHVRVGDAFVIQLIFPILAWIGFGLRHYSEVLALLGMRRPR